MTVSEAIALIYDRIRGKPNTLASYRETLEPFKAKFGRRDVWEMLPIEIKDYLDGMPVSEATRYLRFSQLKTLFNRALKAEKMAGINPVWVNPCEILDYEKPKRGPKPLSDSINDEMKAVEESLGQRDKLIYELGTRAGLRVSEMVKITPSDLIKSGNACSVRIEQPKSRKDQDIRVVPLDLCIKLWQYIEEARIGKDKRVFPLTRVRVWQIFRQRGIAPHDLRRYAAFRALNMGKDLNVIKGLLGHADIATTAKYIGSLSVNKLSQELEGM